MDGQGDSASPSEMSCAKRARPEQKVLSPEVFNLLLPNHIIYLQNHLSPHHSAATTMHRFGNRFHFKSGISPTGIFRNRNHPVPLYVSGTRRKIGIRRSPLTLNLLLPI